MPKFDSNDDNTDGNGRRRVGLEDMNRGRQAYMPDDVLIVDAREAHKREIQKAAPPRIVEPRCHVCQHPYRDWIEFMLIKGQSYKGIGDRVSPAVDRRSISNHYKNHMDLQDTALRAILEQEADLQGQNYEEGFQGAITKRGVLEVAVRKGFEDIQAGVTTVEPRDLIQMTKLLAEMDSHQHQTALDEMRAQVHIFILAIKNICDNETQAQIAAEVKKLRKYEGYGVEFEAVMNKSQAEIPEIVDAEVVVA